MYALEVVGQLQFWEVIGQTRPNTFRHWIEELHVVPYENWYSGIE